MVSKDKPYNRSDYIFLQKLKLLKIHSVFSFCWEMHVPEVHYVSGIGGYKTKCGRICRDL